MWHLLAFILWNVLLKLAATWVAGLQIWYYVLAWWGYILIADDWTRRRRGISVFQGGGFDWLRLGFFSVVIWVVFEMFNFRLEDWSYHHILPGMAVRWIGYTIAYATVLPGLFVTANLIGQVSDRPALSWDWPRSGRLRSVLVMGGGLSLVASLLWPDEFFPLVWLGFIFLLWPWRDHLPLGQPILPGRGRGSAAAALLAAGLVCGFLWEFWNWQALSRWAYHLPWLNRPKVFAMPLAGFLGFIPFALECWLMWGVLEWTWRRLDHRPLARYVMILFLLIFVLLGYIGIDTWTVRSWY